MYHSGGGGGGVTRSACVMLGVVCSPCINAACAPLGTRKLRLWSVNASAHADIGGSGHPRPMSPGVTPASPSSPSTRPHLSPPA